MVNEIEYRSPNYTTDWVDIPSKNMNEHEQKK